MIDIPKLANLHDNVDADVPQLKRGIVWCTKCGHSQKVDSADCLRHGWPKHCGYTMTIDSPEERGARDRLNLPELKRLATEVVGLASEVADEEDRETLWALIAAFRSEATPQAILALIRRVQDLETALEDIKRAAVEGRVCDDVAWFDDITTLYDFCDLVLNGPDSVRAENAQVQSTDAMQDKGR